MILKVCLTTGHILEFVVPSNFEESKGKYFSLSQHLDNVPVLNTLDIYGNTVTFNWNHVMFVQLCMEGKEYNNINLLEKGLIKNGQS